MLDRTLHTSSFMLQDRQQVELAQTDWLKANMGTALSRRLLRIVRDIAKLISAASQEQAHRFPLLAGSHLSPVRACSGFIWTETRHST